MRGNDTVQSNAPWPASIVEISDLVLKWLQRKRERRQLGGLGEHMLRDIGVSRVEVEQEVSKPFWRA
jgi:uncharacterized protein YjiS (DUF1127 family)